MSQVCTYSWLKNVPYWHVYHGLGDKDTPQDSTVCKHTSTKFKAKLPFSLSLQRFSGAKKPPLSPVLAPLSPLRLALPILQRWFRISSWIWIWSLPNTHSF